MVNSQILDKNLGNPLKLSWGTALINDFRQNSHAESLCENYIGWRCLMYIPCHDVHMCKPVGVSLARHGVSLCLCMCVCGCVYERV